MAAGVDSQLANRILLGLLGGAVAGAVTLWVGAGSPAVLEAARVFAVTVLDPIGQVFLRLLFFVVMPLVFASLAAGVSIMLSPASAARVSVLQALAPDGRCKAMDAAAEEELRYGRWSEHTLAALAAYAS